MDRRMAKLQVGLDNSNGKDLTKLQESSFTSTWCLEHIERIKHHKTIFVVGHGLASTLAQDGYQDHGGCGIFEETPSRS